MYNCRHCLATGTCKIAFYIMCQYFGISFKPIVVNPDTNVHIVLSVCIVYIFLRDRSYSSPCDEEQFSVLDLPLPRRKRNTTSKSEISEKNLESVYVVGKD